MRLINTKTLGLEEYQNPPEYAILSHTWADEEVTFQDWKGSFERAQLKNGFEKIRCACQQARRDGYDYLWCDTNCIDKTSSAELSEAINSMFNWYKSSKICYAYLADVPPIAVGGHDPLKHFFSSRWFTRGWTLQELLAPVFLTFFAQDWTPIGTRSELSKAISAITKIEEKYMGQSLYHASISKRMSWLSHRETTRVEDMAYCMFGIFDINMPLLYGEGEKAFLRLQEEIIRVSNDQTIFCWTWDRRWVPGDWVSILSPSPKTFELSGEYSELPWTETYETVPYAMTNAGLSIKLPVQNLMINSKVHYDKKCLAFLDVLCRKTNKQVAVLLRGVSGKDPYGRSNIVPCPIPVSAASDAQKRTLFIAGSRERLRIRDPKQNFEFGALVVLDDYETPYDSITSFPDLSSGVLPLRPLGPERCFGRVLGLETSVDERDGHTTPVVILVFLGLRIEDLRRKWWCRVLEVTERGHGTQRLQEAVTSREQGLSQDVAFPNSEYFHGRRPRSDWEAFHEFGVIVSASFGSDVEVYGQSILAIAHIQFLQIEKSVVP